MICCLGFVIFKPMYMHRISMLRTKNDALSKITNKYQGKGSSGVEASASGSKGSGCQSRELKTESVGSSPEFPEETGQPSLPCTSHCSARDTSCFSKPIEGPAVFRVSSDENPHQFGPDLLVSAHLQTKPNSFGILMCDSCPFSIFACLFVYLVSLNSRCMDPFCF